MGHRLLIVSPDFPPAHGGIQVVVHRLATMMTAFDVTVVTRGTRGDRTFDRSLDVTVRRAPRAASKVLDLALLNATALAAAARTPPDIVLNAHVVTGLATALIGWVSGAPACAYLYADEVVRRPWLASFAIRSADVSVAISEHTRLLALARGASADQVRVILPGVDVPARTQTQRRDRPTVLTVARLEDRFKGHDVIIKALPRVRARVPDVEWVVIGDGSLRPELELAVAEHELEGHVRFLGAVEDAVRDEWLDRAHVFTMPSRVPAGSGGEGFGIVFLEAGAHGLPVVAGRVGGALDAVVHDQTGLLVDPTDPDALADAIAALLLDRQRAEQMGNAGRRRSESLVWSRVAGEVEELLLRLLDRRNGSP